MLTRGNARTPLVVIAVCVAACTDSAIGQQRLIDQRPFDRIVLKQPGEGGALDVLPLRLEGRAVPRPFPPGSLTVQLVSKPGTDYRVNWSDIKDVRLYEQMILDEAAALADQKKFDEAFDYFAFLNKNYRGTPGLEQATARYLQANALHAFQSQQYDLALAILLSLYERNPRSGGIGPAVDTVADRIIRDYIQAGDLRAARDVVDVVEKQFRGVDLAVVRDWRARFKRSADDRVRAGAAALRGQDYRAARSAANAALAILPSHEAAAELVRRVNRQHPVLTVGVRTLAPRDLAPRLDSLASLRASRLARRTITELSGYSPEGGVYTCPVGRVGPDEGGENLQFRFAGDRAESAPFTLARWLLRAADPAAAEYLPPLAAVTDSVRVDDAAGELALRLRQRHVRPESLLRLTPLDATGVAPPDGGYSSSGEVTPESRLFVADHPDAAIAEVQERLIGSDSEALAALTRGEIQVLDRLMPWQLDAARRDRRLAVGSYLLPTVHVLIPTKRSPLLDDRSLRRAMLYAINRRQILGELILGGQTEPGFQVVSGPFPTGRSLSDPVRYAYNDGVEPRDYDPRLGALLAALSWTQAQRAEHGRDDPADRPFPTLRLAHGTDPIARNACESIQMQLKAAGIPIELVELSEDELLAADPDFDLRYAELAVWEPVTDARLLLGPGGVAGRCSDPMIAALKRLDDARNWVEVGEALRGVHELAAGDLPVLPLWQTVNSYAYRRDVTGPAESTVSLYQTLPDWELAP